VEETVSDHLHQFSTFYCKLIYMQFRIYKLYWICRGLGRMSLLTLWINAVPTSKEQYSLSTVPRKFPWWLLSVFWWLVKYQNENMFIATYRIVPQLIFWCNIFHNSLIATMEPNVNFYIFLWLVHWCYVWTGMRSCSARVFLWMMICSMSLQNMMLLLQV